MPVNCNPNCNQTEAVVRAGQLGLIP